MKALFLALILSPLALAQTNSSTPPPSALPLINEQFTAANTRPEKIAGFKARAAELNRRSIALAEQERLWKIKATKEMNANNAYNASRPGRAGSIQSAPLADPKHVQSLRVLRNEMRMFQQEILEERKLRNQLAATAETNRKAITLKQANQTATQAAPGVTQSPTQSPKPAENPPVPKAIPSSVPGLPAGLEPTKRQSIPPPGVIKRN